MTLKEELEILRGEPIQVFTGDPMDIPCIETSDPEKLCKQPVVSVQMITYNHEPYIRQAIEGVMMQKTDFEFELIIGEDCSQDKTREICFEYQKRYPDKIRVLWWHENVSKLGGNGRRCRARCRGEFVALCEGDDYWIDPLKLQKQVNVMREHSNVGLCFCGGEYYIEWRNSRYPFDAKGLIPAGIISSERFVAFHVFGGRLQGTLGPEASVLTASTLFRKSALEMACESYDILTWKLRLGDEPLFMGIGSDSDVYYIPDCMVVYRQNANGACRTGRGALRKDHLISRMYYGYKRYGLKPSEHSPLMLDDFRYAVFRTILERMRPEWNGSFARRYILKVLSRPFLRGLFLNWRAWPITMSFLCGFVNRYSNKIYCTFRARFLKPAYAKASRKYVAKYIGEEE